MKLTLKFLLAVAILVVYDIFFGRCWNKRKMEQVYYMGNEIKDGLK